MKTFRTILAALGMFIVMVLAMAITLRVALHGREISVPNFAGMTTAEASDAALRTGLDLTIENKFYSTTVPAGRMLSQAPAAGSRVRRGWQVRVTESLGPQQVTIPNVAGEPVRQATMDLRRTSLDLGTIAHLEAPGDPDIVLAQTPPPNAGVDQPKVSLLLSSAAGGGSNAMVLPSFVGMGYSASMHLANSLGIRLVYIADTPPPAAPQPSPATPPQSSAVAPSVHYDANGAAIATPTTPAVPVAPATPGGPVTAQKPEAGYRIAKGETVRITFGHPGGTNATQSPGTTPAAPSTPTPSTTP